MRVPVLLGLMGLAAVTPQSMAADAFVSMPGKYFSPAHVTVVAGDEVVFRNSDVGGDDHDVRARDGSFETGRLARFGSFRQPFPDPGVHEFVCTLHPGMEGRLSVVPVLVEAPARPGVAGDPVTLAGRAPAGSGHVMVERLATDGTWTVAGHATPRPDGSFEAVIRPRESGRYRAATDAGAGPDVPVAVASGLRIDTSIRRHRGGTAIGVRLRPAPAGVTVVLERYSRERFSWRRVARARPDARGRASFSLAIRGGRVRVVVVRRGTRIAGGRVVSLRTGRTAGDPTAGDVPASDHGHGGHPPSG